MRPAAGHDAPAAAAIYVDSWNAGFGHLIGFRTRRDDEVERFASAFAEASWWVAERDGRVVGFVAIGDSRDPVQTGLGELDTIAVEPSSWRTGVGRALVETAVGSLRERYRTAILWTVAGYERGHRFYEAMGWSLDGGVRADGAEVRFRYDFTALR